MGGRPVVGARSHAVEGRGDRSRGDGGPPGRVLRRATDTGLVLTHVTQCLRGTVRTDYAGGRALADAGVVGGGDMTAEAALTKLMWLLSQPWIQDGDVRRLSHAACGGVVGRG